MTKSVFLSIALAVGLFAAGSVSAEELTLYQQLGRDIYREVIEIDTTHTTGDTTQAAEGLARRFRAAGFPEADIQVIGPKPRNRNLVVRYRGTGAGTPLVLLAHLDVVEARRADWSFDPFRLTEREGFFYGHGTSDNKDGAAQLSAALLRLRQEDFQPNRDLILALTAGDLDDIRAHGKDERVAVRDFYDGLEFEYQLIRTIATETNKTATP